MGFNKVNGAANLNRKYSSYEDAVAALNTLQSNAALIAQRRQKPVNSLDLMRKFLIRSGVSLEKLDTLSVIHVTGTKGKGSTCALCDTILRSEGVKTGLYASPHLLEVRERIHLEGHPLDRTTFAKYFWKIYNKLNENKEGATDMPAYFQFLTIMAFNVFLEEKVDVAIIEVGIGGAFDSTNILRRVDVVGISSIGYDHMSVLGNTLTDIAWQKAGILKSGSKAITAAGQPLEAARVLRHEARSRKVPLYEAPPLSQYSGLTPWSDIFTPVINLNASLALQLAWTWKSTTKMNCQNKIGQGFFVPPKTAQALAECSLPGRAQHITLPPNELENYKVDLFLDGAHTPESTKLCASWFQLHYMNSASRNILIFNATGGRDPIQLLEPFASTCNFHEAIFCPNLATTNGYGTIDQVSLSAAPPDELIRQCHQNAAAWDRIQNGKSSSVVVETVKEALARVKSHGIVADTKVLITGSLHLVGAVLAVLQMEKEIEGLKEDYRAHRQTYSR